jgi:hypothetical protein
MGPELERSPELCSLSRSSGSPWRVRSIFAGCGRAKQIFAPWSAMRHSDKPMGWRLDYENDRHHQYGGILSRKKSNASNHPPGINI